MILTPFPGTPLFNRLNSENRILTTDWSKYDFEHVVFKPKNMTIEELLNNTRRFYRKVYSIPNIIKRDFKSIHVGVYPFINTAIQNFIMYYRWQN